VKFGVEFRFVFGQRSSCDTIAGADRRWEHNLHRSDAGIRQVITAGIKGEMPSFGKKLGDPDVGQPIAYLRTLHGWKGQPRVRANLVAEDKLRRCGI